MNKSTIDEMKLEWKKEKFDKEKKYKKTSRWRKNQLITQCFLLLERFGTLFYVDRASKRQTQRGINKKFQYAMQLISNENMESRMRGINTLNNIAQDNKDSQSPFAYYSESIFKILCSYIRGKTQETEYQKNYKDKPSPEIQSIIDVLFKDKKHREVYKNYTADLQSTYLVGANFELASLNSANFSKANCQGANFYLAKCEHTNFTETFCKKTDFKHAKCKKADFKRANCSNADFKKNHCSKANFYQTNCRTANFDRADCEGANFTASLCEGASFWHAQCQGAVFLNAKCIGTTFEHANLDTTYLINIMINEQTRFDATSMKGTTCYQTFQDDTDIYEYYIRFYRQTFIKDPLLLRRIEEDKIKTGILTDIERETLFQVLDLPFDPKNNLSPEDYYQKYPQDIWGFYKV